MSTNGEPAQVDSPAPSVPRAQLELDTTALRHWLTTLRRSKLFWLGLGLKLVLAFTLGSHFATRWFGPFVYEFVHGKFGNPWTLFFERGEPLAFPYGPGMLGILSLTWLPALVVPFDPSGHLGLFLLRLPLLVADLGILLFLVQRLRVHPHDALIAYWFSPIVLYSTYVHGQLDLLPTAMLCGVLHLVFTQRLRVAAVLFGLAIATKLHLLISVPFVVVYMYRQRRSWWSFLAITLGTAALLYAPMLADASFRAMVFGSAEAQKLWAVSIPYAPGMLLYVAPAALAVSLLRFASYRKVNRELLLMFLGALYVLLVTLVPPQPGWFLWSTPFVAYLAGRLSRPSRLALAAMGVLYVINFLVADPAVFFEAADPVMGAGWGLATAEALRASAPSLFSPHTVSLVWTALFSTTVLTGLEMYRKGVRSNGIYAFRDQTFMVGVGGDSGAGKHTIARDLLALFPKSMTLVNGDDDHRWERGHSMWRQYTHLDPRGNLLRSQFEGLSRLRSGGKVRKRHYDHDRGKFTEPIPLAANDFVTIVGLHPFYLASQRKLLHLKVFVEPKETIRRAWKIERDVAKRGYTPEQVEKQLDQRAKDSAMFIAPQRQHADVIVRLLDKPSNDSEFAIEYEIDNSLEPLALFDSLQMPGLTIEWIPDAALQRDTLRISGDLDAEALRLLAQIAIGDIDELCDDGLPGLFPGSRGMTQLVLLHAISVRLRDSQGTANE